MILHTVVLSAGLLTQGTCQEGPATARRPCDERILMIEQVPAFKQWLHLFFSQTLSSGVPQIFRLGLKT